MSGFLIDSDWSIDVLHGLTDALAVIVGLRDQRLAISLATYGEIYQGAYYAYEPVVSLAGLSDFLIGKEIIPLSVEIVERYAIERGRLSRQLRQQIGDMDLLIAATALTHELTLLTRNLRDFEHIPGLKLYRAT